MNEDMHPLYDIESYWQLTSGGPKFQVFEHKEYRDLIRCIDFEHKIIFFSDRKRIEPGKIIDINRNLPEIRKIRIMPLISRVMDAEKIIEMPYLPEKLKVYIEDMDEFIGILYYMDSDEKKTIKPIKRFFKAREGSNFLNYDECSFDEYNHYKFMKGDWKNADTGSDKTTNSKS